MTERKIVADRPEGKPKGPGLPPSNRAGGLSRRALLAGLAVAAPATALAAVPLDADTTGPLVAGDDAELLALVATFHRLHAVKLGMERAHPAEPGPQRFAEWTMGEYRAWCRAGAAAGNALHAVFRADARTPAGILAKLTLWRIAYGPRPDCDDPEDSDLGSYDAQGIPSGDDWEDEAVEDPHWRPWLDTIVADLQALAGEVRT